MRIGQRRAVLGLLGIPFVLFGIGSVVSDEHPEVAPGAELLVGHPIGWVWAIAGVFAVMAMLIGGRKQVIEEIGYGLLFIPPFVWMSVCVVTLFYTGSFFIYSGLLIGITLVILILYLSRNMKNG